jgi:hypothetical protein
MAWHQLRRSSLKRSSLLFAVLAAVLWAAPCYGDGLEVEPVIGGIPMHCWDFRGVIVRTTLMTDLGDVGRAWIVTRMPIIALDPDRLATLPAKMQVFFYAHECAHHVLGHTFNRTPMSENEADCWSIKHGRDTGLFTRADVEAFGPYLANSKGDPFGHLPGPEREAHLLRCFDDPSTERASNE